MSDATVISILTQAMVARAKIAAPMLVVSLAVGLFVGLLQSVTQLQEATLTFVPKLAAAGLVIMVAGGWMLQQAVGFTQSLFQMIPELIK